jgi:hypothetical protein
MTSDQKPTASEPVETAPARRRILPVLGGIATAALGLFLLQNLQEVDVHFLWFSFATRLTWALLASTAFGMISLGAFALFRRHDGR